jgi:hypothetical protein
MSQKSLDERSDNMWAAQWAATWAAEALNASARLRKWETNVTGPARIRKTRPVIGAADCSVFGATS